MCSVYYSWDNYSSVMPSTFTCIHTHSNYSKVFRCNFGGCCPGPYPPPLGTSLGRFNAPPYQRLQMTNRVVTHNNLKVAKSLKKAHACPWMSKVGPRPIGTCPKIKIKWEHVGAWPWGVEKKARASSLQPSGSQGVPTLLWKPKMWDNLTKLGHFIHWAQVGAIGVYTMIRCISLKNNDSYHCIFPLSMTSVSHTVLQCHLKGKDVLIWRLRLFCTLRFLLFKTRKRWFSINQCRLRSSLWAWRIETIIV